MKTTEMLTRNLAKSGEVLNCAALVRSGFVPVRKVKLKRENSQVVSATTQLKFLAPDRKRRFADMLDYNGIIPLGKDTTEKCF